MCIVYFSRKAVIIMDEVDGMGRLPWKYQGHLFCEWLLDETFAVDLFI